MDYLEHDPKDPPSLIADVIPWLTGNDDAALHTLGTVLAEWHTQAPFRRITLPEFVGRFAATFQENHRRALFAESEPYGGETPLGVEMESGE